jgi:hypothetical protein
MFVKTSIKKILEDYLIYVKYYTMSFFQIEV